jgi:hypothetical protein
MERYYVNNVVQSNGDHEVYIRSCVYFPSNAKDLHSNCASAVIEAKRTYRQSNGCYYCSNPCHTS